MRIDAMHLCKRFSNFPAVEDVTFSFGSGDIVGFVGPNGAGKSTTMRMLATLLEPDAGDVLYDGISARHFPEEIRQQVGYMPDTLPELAATTIRDYLEFFARLYGLQGAKRRSVLNEVIAFTGLEHLQTKQLKSLSKGMKQRVSLARAILHDPAVLILDEPAAGLDPRARLELRDLLMELKRRGKAILISSHILSELSEFCTAALIIEAGRLNTKGTLDMRENFATEQYLAIALRTLGWLDAMAEELQAQPNVVSLEQDGNEFLITLNGREQAASELLKHLVLKGFPIIEFTIRRLRLEDVYMRLTRGELQ